MSLLRTIFLITSIACVLSGAAFSATVDTVWTNTFYRGYFDSTNCVQETSDGGFIIVGVTWDEGETQTDINVIKTDSEGNLDWSIEIGDTASECGFHVLECAEGGYLISAQSTEYGDGSGGTWIIRTDAAGDTLWTFPFSPDHRNSFPLYAIQTADSGFAIAGLVNLPGVFNDAYILTLDRDGNYLDYANYGGEHYQDGRFITEMEDGGFIVAVWTNDPYSSQTDFRAFRTNAALGVVWDSTYVLSEAAEEAYGACRVEDGVVMVGNSQLLARAIKIDFDGHTVYDKSISLTPYDERPYSVCPTEDGGLMVGGWANVPGNRRDFAFIKLNSQLDTLWTFRVGGPQDDHGHSVVQASDGGYVLAGTSASFYMGTCNYLVKIRQIFNTTTGANVEVACENGVTVTFDNVTGEGDTEVEVNHVAPALPGGWQVVPASEPTFYEISSSAVFAGSIEVCITYDPADVAGEEADLKLYHHDGVAWVDITTSVDEVNNVICGTTTSLSPFGVVEPVAVSVDDPYAPLPTEFRLGQNYPNPFNMSTWIDLAIPEKSHVNISVYNVLGHRIVTLLDEVRSAGTHRIEWDGKAVDGATVASGIYLYRVQTETEVETKKMMLLK